MSNDLDADGELEERFDLLSMLKEIREATPKDPNKMANQTEISELFRNRKRKGGPDEKL